MAELIIGDVRPRNQYTADGVQTTFPYGFPIIAAADLTVVFDDGVTPGSYTVTDVGLSAGGDVVFDTAPAVGTRVTLYRDMPFARETDFQESGDFRASVINEELDRMAMLLQQAEMIVEDGLHKQPYDADDSLILPTAANRASKVLGFDATGLPVTLAESFDSASAAEASATSASASAVSASASAALAQAEADYALNQAVPVNTFTGTGAQTVFTLSRTVNNNTSIIVTVDGVKQHTGTYTASGTTLTFTAAPPNGAAIEAVLVGFIGLISNVATIPDDALSGDMISGGIMDGVSVDGLNGGPLAGLRNRVINGGMSIIQRGQSFTGVANTAFTLDRWRWLQNGAGVVDIARVNDHPLGFGYCLGVTVTTPDTSLTGTDHYALGYGLEGFETQDLRLGNAAAKDVTVSFWVKSPKTGTHSIALTNSTTTRSYPATYTVNAANTWEYKSISLTLDVTGAWVSGTKDRSLSLRFCLASATTFALTPGAWVGAEAIGATGQVNVMDAAQSFYITNVQFEVGSVATPFEYRPFPLEWAMACRYFQKSAGDEQDVPSGAGQPGAYNFLAINTGTADRWHVEFPYRMRTAPTVLTYSTDGTVGTARDEDTATNIATLAHEIADSGCSFYAAAAYTAGHQMNVHWTAEAEL